MQKLGYFIRRWGYAILMMAAIFLLSSTPGNKLPNFGLTDGWIKKGGHMIGYGLLSLSFWHGLLWGKKQTRLAWLLAVLYAVTDEFHQIFVPGRHSSPFDVILFDATGAAIALWIADRITPPGKGEIEKI